MGLADRRSLQLRRGLALSVSVPVAETVSDDTDATLAVTDEHEHLIQKYDVFEVLGQGSSAIVCRGTRKSDGLQVALKKVVVPDSEMLDMVKKEYDTLKRIQHPNIVRALDFFVAVDRAVIVLELVVGMDLDTTLRATQLRRFEEAKCQVLSTQLIDAVAHLHKKRILHRDIKGPNLIISPDHKSLKLLDFNAACQLALGGSLTMTGTYEYCAPEVLLGESPSDVCDVWSAGLCLHLMISGRLPRRVEQYSSLDEFANAVATKPVKLHGKQCWEELSEGGRAVLQRCLETEMFARPAALMLLHQEPWLHSCQTLRSDRGRSSDRPHSPASRSTTFDSYSSGSRSPLVARRRTARLSKYTAGLEGLEDVSRLVRMNTF